MDFLENSDICEATSALPITFSSCDDPSSGTEKPRGHDPPVTDFSDPLITSSCAETPRGQIFFSASLPPVLPPPRPLSPINIASFNWDLYESPLKDGVSLKRRRNSRARSPQEAPLRKRPMKTAPTNSQPMPLPATVSDLTSGGGNIQNGVPRAEPTSETEQASILDQSDSPDYVRNDGDAAEGGWRRGVGSRVAPLHVEPEAGPTPRTSSPPSPSSDVAEVTSNPSTSVNTQLQRPDLEASISKLKPPQPPPKKLIIKYGQLKKRLSSFYEQSQPTSHELPAPTTHSADEATSTVADTPVVQGLATENTDSNHARPMSLFGDAPIDIQTHPRAGPFSEGEMNRSMPRNYNLMSTPPLPSVPPPVPAVGETRPTVPEHISGISDRPQEPVVDDTQPKLTWPGGSLSVQSSFRSFSSEEGEGTPGPETGGGEAGSGISSIKMSEIPDSPHPTRSKDVASRRRPRGETIRENSHCGNTSPTPNRISAHSSFQAFSDEEMEEVQYVSGDSVRPLGSSIGFGLKQHDGSRCYPTSTWPDVSFSSHSTGPGPSACVSVTSEVRSNTTNIQTTTQGRRDPRDTATSAKRRNDAFVERTRRTKFDIERPFTPHHRPFTPRMPTVSHGVPFPSSRRFNVTPLAACPTILTQVPHPGPSTSTACDPSNSLNHNNKMDDLDSVMDSPPAIPSRHIGTARPGASDPSPTSPSNSPQQTYRGDRNCVSQQSSTSHTPCAAMQSTDLEDEPPLSAADKGKGREVDPTSALPSGAPTSQRFAGMKEKIVSSLKNMLPEGNRCDQGSYDYLSRHETNLDLALARLAKGDMGAPATRQDICSLLLLLREILKEFATPETTASVRDRATGRTTRRRVMEQRSAKTLAFQSAIRLYTRELMGRLKGDEEGEGLAPIPVASVRDLENFSKQRVLPSESYFRLDAVGTRMSPWNKALTAVFAQCFVQSTWHDGEDIKLVKTAFSVHLQTLIKNWKAQQRRSDVDIHDDEDLQKGLNADQRRRSLWKRRYGAAASRSELSRAAQVLKDAGMGVVSADEVDGNVLRTLILRPRWRSAEATQFFRDLDKIHIGNKYTATGRPGPGRWPTPRAPSSRRVDEISKAPVGLPVNFYDGGWLRDIGADARKELHAKPRMEFMFSEGTKQVIARHNVVRSHR